VTKAFDYLRGRYQSEPESAPPPPRDPPAHQGEWTVGVLQLLAVLSLIGGIGLGIYLLSNSSIDSTTCSPGILSDLPECSTTSETSGVIVGAGIGAIVAGVFWFTIYWAGAAAMTHVLWLRQKFEPFFASRDHRVDLSQVKDSPPMPRGVGVTHRGNDYLLGVDLQRKGYGIWRVHPKRQPLVESFPLGQAGWEAAYARFSNLEPRHEAVPQGTPPQ
jgi:hypothetical protein